MARTPVVCLGVKGDTVVGNLPLHLADTAHRDDDVGLTGGAEIVESVDIRDLFEQLGLGIGAQRPKPGGGDLQVVMAERAVGMRMAALDDQRPRLQRRDGRVQPGKRGARDADAEV
jgi:hypothetical protein